MNEVISDQQAMTMALDCARQAMLDTTPNPRVGCVIIKDNQVIGQGHTQPPGGNHAEIEALADARHRGADVRGATAYVTLEPCSHYGRTPPCANALVKAGITRVVSAITDPNPLVAGKGLDILRDAGIAVTSGLMQDAAHDINIGFFKRMQQGLPWVRIKSAASLDGDTALQDGRSQWITSEAARNDGHHWRARACAILTGIGTVLDDNPAMTVRALPTPRQPRRIIVDSTLAIPVDARILAGETTWIFTASTDAHKIAALTAAGAEVIQMGNADGQVDLHAMLQELGRRQINELHVEAGATLNAALITQGLADELLLYLAPSLLGDARRMFRMPEPATLDERIRLRFHEVTHVGEDLRIIARFDSPR